MARCSRQAETGWASDRRAHKRLAWALLLSVFVHTLFSASGTPGRSGATRYKGDLATARLQVDLVRTPAAALDPPSDSSRHLAPIGTEPIREKPVASSVARERLRSEGKEVRAPETPRRAAVPGHVEPSGAAHAADSTYYAARQLDVYPALLSGLDFRHRLAAGVARRAGHVLLLVMIDALGTVNEVSVVESDPPGVFDEDARGALIAARFRPALKDGRAVKSRVLVHVSFSSD